MPRSLILYSHLLMLLLRGLSQERVTCPLNGPGTALKPVGLAGAM